MGGSARFGSARKRVARRDRPFDIGSAPPFSAENDEPRPALCFASM